MRSLRSLNEVKKSLYKEKPKANLLYIRNSIVYYQCQLIDKYIVNFEVPTEDMGSADFYNDMDAKLLNRWIVTI
jgi:hypothetical protein